MLQKCEHILFRDHAGDRIFKKVEISGQQLVPEHSMVILGMAWKHVPEVSISVFGNHGGDLIFEKVEI